MQCISESILSKNCLVIQPCKKEFIGFNGSTSSVTRMVEVLVAIGKRKTILSFYVLDLGVHPIIEYSGLKTLRLLVNYVLDTLVGEYGDKVLYYVVKVTNDRM